MDGKLGLLKMTIKEIRTKKRCSCGGKFMLETTIDGENVIETFYCENFCFEKRTIKPPTNVWADYIHLNGKSYMANNRNPEYRETYISEDKKGALKIKFIGPSYTREQLV